MLVAAPEVSCYRVFVASFVCNTEVSLWEAALYHKVQRLIALKHKEEEAVVSYDKQIHHRCILKKPPKTI